MNSTETARLDPKLESLFKKSESKFFSDQQLELILEVCPELKDEVEAARAVRMVANKVVKRVVEEVFAQYDYESYHENARAKCPRDILYVVAYATHSMVARDPKWFDDKVLIWLKTILQAFEFPERKNTSSSKALFADKELEQGLQALPQKSRSIFHTYYRVRQEMSRKLSAEHYRAMEPYLTQALNTLTEEY